MKRDDWDRKYASGELLWRARRVSLTDGIGGPRDPSLLYTPAAVAADLVGLEIDRTERLLRDVDDPDRPAIDAFVRAHAPSARRDPGYSLAPSASSRRNALN